MSAIVLEDVVGVVTERRAPVLGRGRGRHLRLWPWRRPRPRRATAGARVSWQQGLRWTLTWVLQVKPPLAVGAAARRLFLGLMRRRRFLWPEGPRRWDFSGEGKTAGMESEEQRAGCGDDVIIFVLNHYGPN